MSHILVEEDNGVCDLYSLQKFWNLSTLVIAPQIQNYQPICGCLKFPFDLYNTKANSADNAKITVETQH